MMKLKVDQKMKKVSRVEVLRVLHYSVKLGLEPSSAVALKGVSCTSKEGKHYFCHLLLTSHIADVPEAKDMLSVKRGSSTFSPGHTYFDAQN